MKIALVSAFTSIILIHQATASCDDSQPFISSNFGSFDFPSYGNSDDELSEGTFAGGS